jgi:hypothetical protein
MELDEYINLEARVSGRMVLLDISATGEENVIEYQAGNQMNDLEYRRAEASAAFRSRSSRSRLPRGRATSTSRRPSPPARQRRVPARRRSRDLAPHYAQRCRSASSIGCRECPVIARLLDALALPATARMTPRGVKRELTSNMVGPRADKQLLETKLASVEVAGVLRPNELGIAAFAGDGRDYAEIVVLAAKLQDADRRARIEELLHRAVHNPVVLLLEAADASWLSLAHKRPAPAAAAGVMLDHVDTTQIEPTCPTGDAFLDSLAFRPPADATNLFAVYEGWINCVLAAQVAALTGIYRR